MFVDYRGSVWGLLRWQWRPVTAFALAAAAVVVADRLGWARAFEITTLPLAVVGGAIGIFVSFRTNSGYDRWWEGRKLWGKLVNLSRHLTTQVLSYLPDDEDETKTRLVHRHIAYVHTLRAMLRDADPLEDDDVIAFLTAEEIDALRGQSNITHAILHMQMATLVDLARREVIDPLRLQSFDETIAGLLDVQGGCERIQKTPFPRGYGFIADRLILAYGLLLPLGLVEALGWLTIPLSVLVNVAFTLISEVGRVLETPFTMFWPALPLSALSKTIEINLRDRLGDPDPPPLPKPDARGILM